MTQNVQECLRLIRFGWADKAALLVGFAYSSLLLCLWSLAFLVVGKLGAKHLWENFGVLGVELEILIVGFAWLVMRAADFLAGGPAYRLARDKSAQMAMPVLSRVTRQTETVSPVYPASAGA
jgi:hypothetical protein